MEEKSIATAANDIGISDSALVRIEQGKQCGADILANVLFWLIRNEKGKQ
jgi:DNA-binding XRE family transcriptional regulator